MRHFVRHLVECLDGFRSAQLTYLAEHATEDHE